MHNDSKAPASKTPKTIDEILEYPGARSVFEKLCQEVERQWLTSWVLSLPDYAPSRKRRLFVDPKKSRRLAAKAAALLTEIDNLHVIAWRSTHRKRQPSAEHQPAILIDLKGLLFPYQPRSPVKFDVNLLREQLQAASKYFRRVGKAKKPLAWGFEINDMHLQTLLNVFKEHTRKAHYKEIAVLCTAATEGRHIFDDDALKMRVHRARKK